MAKSKETERSADVVRLDRAIDAMLDVVEAKLVRTGDDEIDELAAQMLGKTRVEAAKSLPALFARRSALLGLDMVEQKGEAQPAGSLAELEKKLALVK